MGALLAAQPAQSIESVLKQVQANVAKFEAQLPDFVVDESILSRTLADKRVLLEATYENVFTGVQKRNQVFSFTESREVKRHNGRDAQPGETMRVPFLFSGGFSSTLHSTFGAKSVPLHRFRVKSSNRLGDVATVVVEFATVPGQKELHLDWQGKTVYEHAAGTAWLDPSTLEVIRLQRRYSRLPWPAVSLTVTVDYKMVPIEGRLYNLPVKISVEQGVDKSQKRARGVFVAEYSNYRKFQVSSGIKFD